MSNIFTKVLIANRGEIALRVMRTCERLGIATVAVHTDVDVIAPHVRAADEAVRVESYLDIDAVVAAARDTGAQAVHPGYGFLSERAAFAEALEQAGIALVGPPAKVMEQMGRKDAAREIAIAAGVPVVPRGEDAGFPILVKAAAGGGGKGMRIVRSQDESTRQSRPRSARRLSAFGDDTILVEKYVEHGRHIEVQVIADTHGTVRHLFERDCSTQRRHQKVLEEAPAPTIDAGDPRARDQRSGRPRRARRLRQRRHRRVPARRGHRRGLLPRDEHPAPGRAPGHRAGVRRASTWSSTSSGWPRASRSSIGEVELTGHAIEARVYAEDSFGGFLPQAGTATYVA